MYTVWLPACCWMDTAALWENNFAAWLAALSYMSSV